MDEMPYNPFRPWRHPVRLWRVIAYDVTGLVTAAITFSFVVAFLALDGRTADHVRARRCRSPGCCSCCPVGSARSSDLGSRRWPGCASPTRCRRSRRRRGSGASASGSVREPAGGRSPTTSSTSRSLRSTFALTTAAWAGSLAMLVLPAYVDSLPGDSAKFYFFEVTAGPGAWAAPPASASLGARHRGAVDHDRARPSRAWRWPVRCSGPSADAEHAAQVHAARDQPHGGRRQRRGRAPAHRARPPRRRPAAPGRAGRRPRRGAARSSTPTRRTGASWWPPPTRRPRRRSRRSATWCAASTR